MKANWKECVHDPKAATWSGLYITMNRKGHIVMTKHTYHRLFEAKAFVLLFDSVNNRIGLKPAALSMRNAYKVGPHGKYGGKIIFAYRLTQEFGIDIRETIEFTDPEIDHDGILVLDLRTARVSNRIWTKQRHEEWKRKHPRRRKPLAVSGEREISSQLSVVSSQTETSDQPLVASSERLAVSGEVLETSSHLPAVSHQPAISTQPSAVSVRPERAAAPSAFADEDDDGSCYCFQCLSGNVAVCLELAVAR
jgi:hypothetical protein